MTDKKKKISALKIKLAEAEKQSRDGNYLPFREAIALIKNKIIRRSKNA